MKLIYKISPKNVCLLSGCKSFYKCLNEYGGTFTKIYDHDTRLTWIEKQLIPPGYFVLNSPLTSINLEPYFVVSLGMHGPHSWDLPLFKKGGRISYSCCKHGELWSPYWEELLQIWWGGLKSKHGGSMGELKMLPKNTCEGLHLTVKLRAVSLQASKNWTSSNIFFKDFS